LLQTLSHQGCNNWTAIASARIEFSLCLFFFELKILYRQKDSVKNNKCSWKVEAAIGYIADFGQYVVVVVVDGDAKRHYSINHTNIVSSYAASERMWPNFPMCF